MSKKLYSLLMLTILTLFIGVGYAQDVPELMYFKFDQSTGNQTPNDANPATRVGGATATIMGNLTVGGVGQFNTGLQGTATSSASNYLDPGWTGNYTGDWTISMYLDVTESGSNGTQYFFGSGSSSSFRCFTGGVANDGVLLRGTGIADVTIPDLYSGPVVVTFSYNATTNTIKGYKNGVLVITLTNWTSPTLQGSDFKVSGYSSNDGVNGVMDEFRFYNRALDDSEIGATWNQMLPLTDCSGQPSLGLINGPTEVCPDLAFSLSATGTNAAGFTFQWQESAPGANNWNDIVGAVGISLTFPNGINTAADYRVIATCTNSNLSDTSNVLTVTMTTCYCEPSYSFGCSLDNIRDVILAGEVAPGINNLNTPCPPTGYQDYSATMSATLLAGNTYSGNVTTDYSSASENVRIWIDYNQNGIFEANETVATLANLSSSSTGAFSFTVPPTTLSGTYKMRVRLVWSTSPLNIDPCTVESYGETHDYTILIDGLCTDPIVDLGPDVTICEGESVTLDAGNPGLDFEWNDNSTGQTLEVSQSGTYTVTVTDGDCSTTASVEVTVQDLPIVDLGGDETICEGESITLDAGNPGADFEWSDNSTGQTLDVTAEGTYSVTVTEGTCFASDTVAVSYIDAPTADGIIANEQEDCFFTFSVDNAQNVVYYEWDFGDGSPATIGAAVNYNYPQSGTYDVTLDMVSSCGDTLTLTKVVKCDNGIGIDEVIADKNAVTLYPNPTTDLVTIESENNLSMEQVTVYNVLGQKVYQNTPMSQFKHSIDVSKMASGVYTIHVQTNDGVIIRKFEIIK